MIGIEAARGVSPAVAGGFARDLWSDHAIPKMRHSHTAAAEFAAICLWLGKARRVTPLQATPQTQLVIEFAGAGRFLVAVKVKAENSLTFKPAPWREFLDAADAAAMPALVAWKQYSVWVLCEARQFRPSSRNFSLGRREALAQNLLGVLAGDMAFTVETDGADIGGYAHQAVVRRIWQSDGDGCPSHASDGIAGWPAIDTLDELMRALDEAKASGAVSQVFRPRPRELPAFPLI